MSFGYHWNLANTQFFDCNKISSEWTQLQLRLHIEFRRWKFPSWLGLNIAYRYGGVFASFPQNGCWRELIVSVLISHLRNVTFHDKWNGSFTLPCFCSQSIYSLHKKTSWGVSWFISDIICWRFHFPFHK